MAIKDDEDDFEDDAEVPEEALKHSRVSRSFGARKGGKGHLMSIMAKLKKVHPAVWIAGLGGAALVVDYFVEGEASVASSLYRGIFGGHGGRGAHGGRGGGGGLASSSAQPSLASAMPAALPVLPTQVAPYGYPIYYSAYPYQHSYDRRGFGHGGHGGYGGHDGHEGHGAHGHFGHGVRGGGYPWE